MLICLFRVPYMAVPRFPPLHILSRVFQSRVFHPCNMVPRFPVPRFSPLQYGPAFSSPAFSTPAFFTVPRFPVPRFQRPRRHVLNCLHNATYPPLFDAPLGGIPFEFLDETYRAKTRGIGLLYGENFMILASTVFDWSTRVTDRQTDGR